jgi:CitB family two-component system response regulator MalR
LVDDDPITITICERIISHTGFAAEIVSAYNGSEAFNYLNEVLKKNDVSLIPQLIFLDLNMPVMDGWGFLDVFNELAFPAGHVPVICILSSTVDRNDNDKAFTYPHVSKFISKPLTKDMLETIQP